MENKTSLPLMELLVMILVFALAAAMCLGVFAKAQQISRETSRRETAAVIAQNGAELLKSGGSLEEMSLPDGYYTVFCPQETHILGVSVGIAEVWLEGEKEPIFSLPVAWQEVQP